MKTDGKNHAQGVRVLRMQSVCEKVGLGRSSVYELIANGKFPRSFRLTPGGRAVGWLESDLDAWLMSRRMSSEKDKPVKTLSNRGGAK